MRLGFNLPQIGPAAGPEAIVTVAAAAEDMGLATLWVADRLLSGALPEVFHGVIDPVGTLTFVAAHTTQVRLGTSILNLPWYRPALLARQLTALDVLSNRRLRVGFGRSGPVEDNGFQGVGSCAFRLDRGSSHLSTSPMIGSMLAMMAIESAMSWPLIMIGSACTTAKLGARQWRRQGLASPTDTR